MKKLALILTIILALCFSLTTTCSLAEEKNTLEVLLTPDKAEYAGGETIVATLTVTNNYAVDIALIQMENLVPENCELAVASKATATVENLESGETAELVTRFVTPAAAVLPHTGDAAHPMVWAMLAAAALAGMIWLFVCRRKAFFCLFAMLMVSALLTSGGLVLARADIQSNVTTVSTTVMVDGMPLVLHAEVIEGAGKNIYKAPDPEHIRDSVDSIGQYVDNQLLLVAEEEVTQEQIEALIASHNGTVVGCIDLTDDFQIEFPAAYTEIELEAIAAEWLESELLIRADINAVYEWAGDSQVSAMKFDDPKNTKWALEAINAEGAWQYQDYFDYPNIGIIDGDFDTSHSDLASFRIRLLSNTGTSSTKYLNHGTRVLGILAAKPFNGIGLTGMALEPVVYAYPVKVSEGSSNRAEWKSVLQTMLVANCKVINVSMGGTNIDINQLSDANYYKKLLKQSEKDGEIFDAFFDKLIKKNKKYGDFLIVQAAGNDSANASLNGLFVMCQKYEDRILVVGNANINSDGDYYLFRESNYGPRVDIVAPGTSIVSTIPGGYNTDMGTSFSAPFVSGTAALCYAINPDLTGSECKEIIIDSAQDIVPDTNSLTWDPHLSRNETNTYKMLNAQAAVEMAGDIEPDDEEDPEDDSSDDELLDNEFIVTARYIDPDTGKPLSELDGLLQIDYGASDSAVNTGEAYQESENPISVKGDIEKCNDTTVLVYVRKNGDWATITIDPLKNQHIDLGDIELNEFDPSEPYIKSTKEQNGNGTVTVTLEAFNIGAVKYHALVVRSKSFEDTILDITENPDAFSVTDTSVSFTVDESELGYVWSWIYTLADDGSVGDFVVDFDEYVAGNGLGELRFNTNIPTNYPTFSFWIDNPID